MPKLYRAVARIFIVLALVEAMCFGFATLSIYRGNAYRFFYPSLFGKSDYLAREREASAGGWRLGGGGPRPQPIRQATTCGAALGGSFTYGDDLGDAQTWPSLLTQKLGCNIDNLGVDGFAIDESQILYEQSHRHDRMVILGLASVMFNLDNAASMTFLTKGADDLPETSPIKPIYTLTADGNLTLVPLPTELSAGTLLAYHRKDLFRRMWTELRFPYSYSVIKAAYRHFTVPRYDLKNFFGNDPEDLRTQSIAWKIIRRLDDEITSTGGRLMLLMIPSPDDVQMYSSFVRILRSAIPADVCVAAPLIRLRDLQAKIGKAAMRTKSGHFSSQANAALADVAANAIATCGIAL